MATTLGLSLKISANAEEVGKGLSQADKELNRFAGSLNGIGKQFDSFASEAGELPATLQGTVDKMAALGQAFREGEISQEQFKESFKQLKDAAYEQSAAFKRGKQVTESLVTSEEKLAREQKELDDLFTVGAISSETYSRGIDRLKASSDRAATSTEKVGLELNELTGLVGLLPGPLGQFAARLSSVFSAGNGISKLFSGGLQGALAQVGTKAAALANPFTIAAGSALALGTAAVKVAGNLVALEQRVENIGRASRLIGADFNFGQALEISARRVGRSFTELQEPLARFANTMERAKNGDKNMVAAFERIGISAEELEGMTLDETLQAATAAFRDIEDPAKRAAAEIAVFGEQGPKLRDVWDGIGDATGDVGRLGAAISKVDQENITRLGSTFDDLGVAVTAFGDQLTTPFVAMGNAIAGGLTTATAGLGKALGAVLDALSPVTTVIGYLIGGALDILGAAFNGLAVVLEPFAAVGRTLSEMWSVLGENTGKIVDIFIDAQNTMGSFFTSMYDWTEPVQQLGEWLSKTFGRVFNIAVAAVQRLGEYVASTVAAIGEWIASSPLLVAAIDAIGAGFQYMYDSIAGPIQKLGEWFGWLLDAAESALGISDQVKPPKIAAEEVEAAASAMSQYSDEISKAQEKTANLGAEGFEAALKYQEKLQEIAELQAEGEYTQEEANRAVARATEEFDNQTASIEKRNAAAQKALEADQAIVANLEKQAQIEAQFGGDNGRYEAAKNLEAINREIARTEEAIAKARAEGDQEAIDASTARLAQLDQMASRQEDIASGQVAAAEEMEKYEKKLFDAAKKRAELDEQRIEELNRIDKSPLKAVDANSAAGKELAYRIAQGDDPALERWDKQYQKLDEIKKAIQKDKPKTLELA